MCFILKSILITYLSFFLTGPILITIYNIFKYLSCIKSAYNSNNNNNNNNNSNNNNNNKAKNKYMNNHDKSIISSFLMYLDANNFYG